MVVDSRDQDEERGGMRMLAWMLLVLAAIVSVAVFTSGCGLQDLGGGSDVAIPGFGNVFVCDLPAGPSELCWKDDDATELGALLDATCAPTERHAGPCIYRCSGETGCNALDGCYCPETSP